MASTTTRWIAWRDAIETLQSAGGEWRLLWRDAPVRRARNLMDRAHPSLQGVEGIIIAKVTHSYVGVDGVRRGDIWGQIVELTTPSEPGTVPTGEGNEDVG